MRSVMMRLLVVAGILISSAANADEDPRRAQAEALLKEGAQLHEASKEEEALARYRRAYEVYPTPNILFAIASSEHTLGRNVDAIRHYREALKSRTLHPKNVERGQEYVRELEAKLGRLEVKAPPGTSLSIDGARYDGPIDEPIDIEPGDHSIEATQGDKRKSARVACHAGKLASVTIDFEDTGYVGPITEPPKEEPASSSLFTTRNVVGGSAAVFGIAAAAVGVGFLIDSNNKADEANSIAAGGDTCPQQLEKCARYRDDLFDASSSSRTGAYVGFITGGVLVAGAIAVFALWPSSGGTRGALRTTFARNFIGLGADF